MKESNKNVEEIGEKNTDENGVEPIGSVEKSKKKRNRKKPQKSPVAVEAKEPNAKPDEVNEVHQGQGNFWVKQSLVDIIIFTSGTTSLNFIVKIYVFLC